MNAHRSRLRPTLGWLLVSFVALVGALSACSADSLELVMRARDGIVDPLIDTTCRRSTDPVGPSRPFFENFVDEIVPADATFICSTPVAERVFVSQDGQRAVSPAHVMTIEISNPIVRNIACGGQTYARLWGYDLRSEASPSDDEFELDTSEGSRLTLDPERGLWVAPGSGAISCAEMGGSWRGTSGDLRGHTGTFTMVYDSVQTVLHIVEA